MEFIRCQAGSFVVSGLISLLAPTAIEIKRRHTLGTIGCLQVEIDREAFFEEQAKKERKSKENT